MRVGMDGDWLPRLSGLRARPWTGRMPDPRLRWPLHRTDAVKVPIEIERSLRIPLPHAQVRPLLDDLERTIRRFPKLRRLKKLSESDYLWEMRTIGSRIAGIAHDVSYAARYRVDPDRDCLSWTPLDGYGNARIAGRFTLRDCGPETDISFRVDGELRDVPVPLMYRLMAPPFIQGKFTRLVETFLDNTRAALLSGEVVGVSAKPARRRA